MTLEKFDLAALCTIDDGRIRTLWELAMKRVRFDCEDRPGVEAARKVTLVATLVPGSRDDGTLDTVSVTFDVDDSLPKRRSGTYVMKADRGGLFFNDLSKDNPHQGTLDDVGGPTGVAGGSDAS